LVIIEP